MDIETLAAAIALKGKSNGGGSSLPPNPMPGAVLTIDDNKKAIWTDKDKLSGSLTLGMGTNDEVTITAAQLKQVILNSGIDLTNVYRFKGSVDTVSDLPKNASAGDVWDVKARGINYAWTGEEWDALGELFAVDAITDSEIDALFQ